MKDPHARTQVQRRAGGWGIGGAGVSGGDDDGLPICINNMSAKEAVVMRKGPLTVWTSASWYLSMALPYDLWADSVAGQAGTALFRSDLTLGSRGRVHDATKATTRMQSQTAWRSVIVRFRSRRPSVTSVASEPLWRHTLTSVKLQTFSTCRRAKFSAIDCSLGPAPIQKIH